MAQISVLGKEGDTRLIWDKRNQVEVDAARRMFDDLKTKGYLAFSVVEKAVGDKGEQLRTFDPNAEKIIMAPPMQGGSGLPIVAPQQEAVTDLIIKGEYTWCRARLLHALAGAAEQGILQAVIDELMSVPITPRPFTPAQVEAGWEAVEDEPDGTMIARWLIEAMETSGWLRHGRHVPAGG